jgi:hypothetical protein
MHVESMRDILNRCQQSRAHNDRMRSLIPKGVAPSLRTNFARCAIDLAMEHHSALIRVTEAGEYGTAGALLRPVLEASTAGYWFVYAATCREIQALPTTSVDNPEADIPILGDMLKPLVSIFPDIQKLSDGFKRGGQAKWLHKYTHGGAPQLTRRVNDGWTEDEVILTLIRSDMFSVLAACLETVIAPSAPLTEYGFNYRDELAFELQTKWVVDPIPWRPHRLPDAPLLQDGCGPSFS